MTSSVWLNAGCQKPLSRVISDKGRSTADDMLPCIGSACSSIDVRLEMPPCSTQPATGVMWLSMCSLMRLNPGFMYLEDLLLCEKTTQPDRFENRVDSSSWYPLVKLSQERSTSCDLRESCVRCISDSVSRFLATLFSSIACARSFIISLAFEYSLTCLKYWSLCASLLMVKPLVRLACAVRGLCFFLRLCTAVCGRHHVVLALSMYLDFTMVPSLDHICFL